MPVNSPGDVINDPQLSSRNFWEEIVHDELGQTITYPGAPCKLSEMPGQIKRRAPLIGEHNQQVYAELGFSEQLLVQLKEANVI
jgi:crotonobetainyl-CoA:carnitine CoA-transferase CaiB-like acyl-CoA transferase